jgi:hypothetical protein
MPIGADSLISPATLFLMRATQLDCPDDFSLALGFSIAVYASDSRTTGRECMAFGPGAAVVGCDKRT